MACTGARRRADKSSQFQLRHSTNQQGLLANSFDIRILRISPLRSGFCEEVEGAIQWNQEVETQIAFFFNLRQRHSISRQATVCSPVLSLRSHLASLLPSVHSVSRRPYTVFRALGKSMKQRKIGEATNDSLALRPPPLAPVPWTWHV